MATLENEYRKTIAQILGGIGLFTGLYFTWKQIKVNEDGQITARFTNSISHLGDRKLDIRLGGIYALERIAKDSPKDHPQIIEILSAFIREHSKAGNSGPTVVTTDIQATVTVIGRRNTTFDRAGQRIDLSRAQLLGADLINANLQEAVLLGANLGGAKLSGANLQNAKLDRANLRGAKLYRANLQNAQLEKANLRGAKLSGANLQNAILERANLRKANLCGADLQRAFLCGADLWGAELIEANLQGANLCCAELQGAFLGEANLRGTILIAANLQEANLYGVNLQGAKLYGANLQGANLKLIKGWDSMQQMNNTIISAVKEAPEGFIEFAKSKGAIESKEEPA